MLTTKYNKGFTLIELLVVIAIIGILSVSTVVSLGITKKKARDAERLAEIVQIQKALEIFYSEYGRYPDPDCSNITAIGKCSSVIAAANGLSWIPELSANIDNLNIPNDPINIGSLPNYNGEAFSYIFTRDINLDPNTGKYYYILFKREIGPQTDSCNGKNPYLNWSCIGGGQMP